MAKKEITKGYLNLRGEIYGLDRNAYENKGGTTRTQFFTIKVAEEKRIPVKLGKWKNTTMSVKMKADGMDKAIELNEQEAIDEIKDAFANGDSVFVKCRAEVNAYNDGELEYYLNGIYVTTDKIDFKATGFTESNELSIPGIIADKIKDGKQKVEFVDYKGETMTRDLICNDKDICEYLEKESKIGDLIPFFIVPSYEPIYEDVKREVKEGEEAPKKTFKNRNNGGQNTFKKQVGKIETFEIVDFTPDEIEVQKYDMEATPNKDDEEDMPF